MFLYLRVEGRWLYTQQSSAIIPICINSAQLLYSTPHTRFTTKQLDLNAFAHTWYTTYPRRDLSSNRMLTADSGDMQLMKASPGYRKCVHGRMSGLGLKFQFTQRKPLSSPTKKLMKSTDLPYSLMPLASSESSSRGDLILRRRIKKGIMWNTTQSLPAAFPVSTSFCRNSTRQWVGPWCTRSVQESGSVTESQDANCGRRSKGTPDLPWDWFACSNNNDLIIKI